MIIEDIFDVSKGTNKKLNVNRKKYCRITKENLFSIMYIENIKHMHINGKKYNSLFHFLFMPPSHKIILI